MTPRTQQAFNAYLTQRWARPALLAVGVAYLLGMGIGLSQSPVSIHPPLFVGLLGGVVLVVAVWVTGTAKWQFVHPRARMTPGFSGPHLGAAAAWLAVGTIVYPLSLSLVLTASVPALLAYSLAVGALQVWGMHANRMLISPLTIALFMAPNVPQTAPFWTDNTPTLFTAQCGLIAVSLLALAAWLWRLPRLTEESGDYLIPAHAQSGKASRMEKSEARRNMARHFSRSGFFLSVSDRWHDPLARHQASSTAQRQRLLRYGFSAAPIAVRSLGVLLMLLLITGTNAAVSGNDSPLGLVISGIMVLFLGASLTSSRMAMRQPRMQTELLLPLSRADWVTGLFRVCARDTVALTAVAGGALAAWIFLLAPAATDTINARQALAFTAAALAALVAGFATSMQAGLITSGIKRATVLMLGLYAVIVACGVSAGLSFWASPVYGLAVAAALLVAGLLLLRRAHRNWLNAELG